MIRTTFSAVATLARRQLSPNVFNLPAAAAALPPSSRPSSDCGCGRGRGCLSSPSSAVATSQQSRSMTILSKESKEEFKKENYSARMAATARPVSPHVTIYAFPACALSSITTRVTGCALSFGSVGLGAVEILGGNGAALELMSALGGANVAIAAGAKFVVAFPLVYHYLGGLRHVVWDNNPEMLSNVDVEKTSYLLVGTSLLVSGAAVFV
jgi:succinate dehydrogenase (ubiquinone) cytochrome b560 subunit